jgi:hypothetical protein
MWETERRVLLAVALFIGVSVSAFGATPSDYRFSAEQGNQHIEVFLEIRPFDSRNHKLEIQDKRAFIDGKIPLGIGPGSFSAQTEFSRFEVRWNGKPVQIPTSLYADLFNPSLVPKTSPTLDRQGSIWTSVSSDGASVLLEIEGGNDAVSYKAWIVVSHDGKCLRFVADTTP